MLPSTATRPCRSNGPLLAVFGFLVLTARPLEASAASPDCICALAAAQANANQTKALSKEYGSGVPLAGALDAASRNCAYIRKTIGLARSLEPLLDKVSAACGTVQSPSNIQDRMKSTEHLRRLEAKWCGWR